MKSHSIVGARRGVCLQSLTAVVCAILISAVPTSAQQYCWLDTYDTSRTVARRIDAPEGFDRIEAAEGTFEHWLQALPLKKPDVQVYLYDGRVKGNRQVYCAVVDVDVGSADLQQCADAIIRLRAEYFYSLGQYDSISFNFTNGDEASFRDWIDGVRPEVRGNDVSWTKTAEPDSGYATFRDYLNTVFMYAGTYSLNKELKAKSDVCNVSIGDVFIQGGFPGHAVIVVDIARNRESGKTLFLLAQGFTPAQDIHILTNPTDPELSPWYDCDFGETLLTPEWTFKRGDLKSW